MENAFAHWIYVHIQFDLVHDNRSTVHSFGSLSHEQKPFENKSWPNNEHRAPNYGKTFKVHVPKCLPNNDLIWCTPRFVHQIFNRLVFVVNCGFTWWHQIAAVDGFKFLEFLSLFNLPSGIYKMRHFTQPFCSEASHYPFKWVFGQIESFGFSFVHWILFVIHFTKAQRDKECVLENQRFRLPLIIYIDCLWDFYAIWKCYVHLRCQSMRCRKCCNIGHQWKQLND